MAIESGFRDDFIRFQTPFCGFQKTKAVMNSRSLSEMIPEDFGSVKNRSQSDQHDNSGFVINKKRREEDPEEAEEDAGIEKIEDDQPGNNGEHEYRKCHIRRSLIP